MQLYHNGALGGEVMPEDANPGLGRETSENYSYFTLPIPIRPSIMTAIFTLPPISILSFYGKRLDGCACNLPDIVSQF